MHLFDVASLSLDLISDLDRFEERLGAFFAARPFDMRVLAHSSAFPMQAPIQAIQRDTYEVDRLYTRTLALRTAIDAWWRDHAAADLHATLTGLAPDVQAELAERLCAACPALPACLDGTATDAAWEQFVGAVDRLFWRVLWVRQAAEMYRVMERRVLRAVRYTLITWEPADVSAQAIRAPLAAITGRPVTRIDHLPPVLHGIYREHLSYLEPEEPEQPFLAVLTSYDCAGEWSAALFHELIALPLDITIALDVSTLNRTKSQRVAELAYNAARLVARDQNLVDIRGERVVQDAREVLGELKRQTLHTIQVAILVRGADREELEANVVSVRDLFGPRLKLLRPNGAQRAALQLFSTLPRHRLDAPWKPRTQLSKVVGCAAGMIGFHRPNRTDGLFIGVERVGRFPVFINLFERNQAAHMLIAGSSGYGKTVFMNLLAERAASLGNMQVIGIDAFSNGLRVERALEDCVCFKVGLEHVVNPLDVVFDDDAEGGWLNNQILHSVGQILLLLGEPGESHEGRQRFIPLPLQTGERGVLSLAIKRLYQRYRVTPQTPASGTPGLSELIGVLDELRDPLAERFATRLRYFIYGNLHDTTEKTPEGIAFDGQTTIDWRFENRVVYYDFKGVPDLLLPLFYAQGLGKTWRYITTRTHRSNIFLQIDEFGHASQIAAVVNTAWTIAKTARKYGAGLVLVDQTMRPFLDTAAGRQLHANAAAHFLFRMQDVEAGDVARAMSLITPRHAQFITEAEPGQCLGVIRKDVYELNVECHPLEAGAFLNS